MAWIPISRMAHYDMSYHPRDGFHHARGLMAVPILFAELGKVLNDFVIGFIKRSDALIPVAILGARPGENLYLQHDGRWLADYVPAALRGYPFAVEDRSSKERKFLIEDNQLTKDTNAKSLFSDQGELSDDVKKTLTFLRQCSENNDVTSKAAMALSQSDVIKPWTLEVVTSEKKSIVEGLLKVDEKALHSLTKEAFVELQGPPLALAYAQIFSCSNIHRLRFRAELQGKESGGANSAGQKFLKSDDDDLFDFSEYTSHNSSE
jgi:hypothetical protein